MRFLLSFVLSFFSFIEFISNLWTVLRSPRMIDNVSEASKGINSKKRWKRKRLEKEGIINMKNDNKDEERHKRLNKTWTS